MNNQTFSTIQQINNLIEFGQAVNQTGFDKSQDALLELLDALIERPYTDCKLRGRDKPVSLVPAEMAQFVQKPLKEGR